MSPSRGTLHIAPSPAGICWASNAVGMNWENCFWPTRELASQIELVRARTTPLG